MGTKVQQRNIKNEMKKDTRRKCRLNAKLFKDLI